MAPITVRPIANSATAVLRALFMNTMAANTATSMAQHIGLTAPCTSTPTLTNVSTRVRIPQYLTLSLVRLHRLDGLLRHLRLDGRQSQSVPFAWLHFCSEEYKLVEEDIIVRSVVLFLGHLRRMSWRNLAVDRGIEQTVPFAFAACVL